MSIESAKKFIEKLRTDQEFAKKIAEIKDKETRMKFARENGFDFTPEEIKQLPEELSDEDLDNVAGGRSSHFDDPYHEWSTDPSCWSDYETSYWPQG